MSACHFRLAASLASVLLLSSAPGWAAPAKDSGALCDELAAGTIDNRLPKDVRPVSYDVLDGEKARAACETAVRAHPDVPRYLFQLNRAFTKLKKDKEAIAALGKAIEMGYPAAYAGMGYRYQTGEGLKKDLARALELYLKAADLGLAYGYARAGEIYQLGGGPGPDYVKAAGYLQQGVAGGDPFAMLLWGDAHIWGFGVEVNYARAMALLKRGYDGGAREGADRIAMLYENGLGVMRDRMLAREWYQKAIEANYLAASIHLAKLEWDSPRNKQSAAIAVAHFRRAAEEGNAEAMLRLGYAYDTGRGIRQDARAALEWYEKAAAKSQPDGVNTVGSFHDEGIVFAQDQAKALPYFRRAADLGSANGMYNLARYYQWGIEVPQDMGQAIVWYERAASIGLVRAMATLGEIYGSDPVYRDAELSFDWHMRAAAQADSGAMINVGWAYQEGLGVKIDNAKAMDWYRKSANLGNVFAMNNIGVLYSNGRGVDQDYAAALDWFRKAVDAGNYGLAHFNIAVSYRDGLGVSPDAGKSAEHLIAALAAGDETPLSDLRDNKALWPDRVLRSLQETLRKQGRYKGPTDGTLNVATQEALRTLLAED